MSSNTEEWLESEVDVALTEFFINALEAIQSTVNGKITAQSDAKQEIMHLIQSREATLKAEYEEKIREEKLGLIDRLNKKIFYANTNPRGQHVKDCLMGEFGNLQPKTPKKELEQDE